MAKIRLHELAKELNVEAKEIISFLGEDMKPISVVDEDVQEKVRKKFSAKNAPASGDVTAKKPALQEKPSGDSRKAAPQDANPAAPKKKKPILLLRPENSSFGKKKDQNPKSSGTPGGRDRDQRRPSQNDNRRPQPQEERRTMIKPSVPTTAQQYMDYRVEEPKKPAVQPKKERKPEPEEIKTVQAAAVNVPEVQEQAVPVQDMPVQQQEHTMKLPDVPVQENPAKEATAEAEHPNTEAMSAMENKAEEAAEKKTESVSAKPVTDQPRTEHPQTPQDQRPQGVQDRYAERPQRNDRRERQENQARQARDDRARTAQAGQRRNDDRRDGRPAGSGQYSDRPRNPQSSDGQGQHKFFVDRRKQTPDGTTPGGRRPYDPNRPQGQNQGERRTYDRNRPQGQGQGQSQGGQGQNRFQPRDGNYRPRPGQGTPGGQGAGSRRPGGTGSSRFSGGGMQGDGVALSKADVRGKKSSNNRQQNNRPEVNDKNGKRAENFKNLSKGVNNKKNVPKKEEEQIKMIVLPETLTIKDLAEAMKQKPADLIKKLFLQGKMYTVNSDISYEEAEEIAIGYNILCEKEEKVDVIEELLKEDEEDEALMVKRPPVVCVMGHVDHGKTSLLDAIRSTNVTAKEAGGITQHIGAYMVEINGEKITFLDTPGHEAFTAMRMRGAQATDIAILVVAADDGVMPQTVEAINHAKAAGVEIIVAINKIDKPGANLDHVRQELAEYGLIPESWGGNTIFVPVSAKTGEGIDDLLENVILLSEVLELKANPNREMRGIVIEAKLDRGRGPVATVLVQKGTLKTGQMVSAGSFFGRVRAMLDADGNNLKSALPSTPVEILGLNGVPNAGEICIGHKNEREAREYAETFISEHRKEMLADTKAKLTMDSLFAEIKAGNIKELPIVVKADVQGSVEAVRQSLEKLSNEEVAVKVIHGGVGAINESDITLASASNAIVIGFNVKPDAQAKQLAESESVDMRLYRVIYQAIEDVEAAMKGMLAPVYEEKLLGHAEVRQIFKASGIGTIAGSYVLDGTFERGCRARLTRDKEQLFDGPLASLKRFKDDVREVREGYECGIVLEKFNDIQEGDLIEAYKMVQVERT